MPVPKNQLIASLLVFFLVTTLIVTPIVLWATTREKGTIQTHCSSDADCNNHGTCVNGACKCNSPWGGPFCNVLGNLAVASTAGGASVNCSQTPLPCKNNADCAPCSTDIEYSCQSINASQNAKGVTGNFCLPTPPASDCLTGVTRADSIPGTYTWNGWADVETQQWTCNCEFPNFYPLDTVSNTSACIKKDSVCQFGDWTYPCLRDPKDPLVCLNKECTDSTQCSPEEQCLPIKGDKKVCQLPVNSCTTVGDCPGCDASGCPGCTPDQLSAYCGQTCVNKVCYKTCKVDGDDNCGSYPCVNGVCLTSPSGMIGSNPFQYGLCDCANQSCDSDAQCAGTCYKGTCVNQRVALGPDGAPTCVKDTCAPGGAFQVLPIPPYTYGYCECSDGYVAQGNTCVYTGNDKPSTYCALGCGRGKCVAPGKCSCPSGWRGNSICTQSSCDMKGGCGFGSCVGPNLCSCDPGYTTDANGACTVLQCPSDCGVHGTCQKVNQVPTCVCDPGWSGPNCNTPAAVTCPTLQRQSSGVTDGACVSMSNPAQCTFEAATNCGSTGATAAYFGNSASFTTSFSCNDNCVQGYTQPQVASLPSQLCSDGQGAVPCSTSSCSNKPLPLNTCMENDLYAYSCTDLCDAFATLQPYDYNTLCLKKTASTKPSFCT